MMGLGTLGFTAPWILTTLVILPIIYWLLRVTPPQPNRVWFPATNLLKDLEQKEETPQRTPLWLVLMRMLMVALLLLALAGPLLLPQTQQKSAGPLIIVVDTGWAAAPQWQARLRLVEDAIAARRQDQPPVLVVPTDLPLTEEASARWLAWETAANGVATLEPHPFVLPRRPVLPLIESALGDLEGNTRAQIVWVTDGLEGPSDAGGGGFAAALAGLGDLTIAGLPLTPSTLALMPPRQEGEGLVLTALRAQAGDARPVRAALLGESARIIATADLMFEPGAVEATAALPVPTDILGQARRIELQGGQSAGSVFLLDDSWRRRLVGIVAPESAETAQPLLSKQYYLEKAFQATTQTLAGTLSEVMDADPSIIVLADIGQIPDADVDRLADWIEGGGVLLRFAGPRTANQAEQLLPVPLRRGGRVLGGALSWAEPQRLEPFSPDSPFFGLTIPSDVSVTRQVLAEPSIELSERTWARLADNTPLVTGQQIESGWLVLFHITANPDWSNLPLSGLFVEMLDRLVALTQGGGLADAIAKAGETPLPPVLTLTGLGALRTPPPGTEPLPTEARPQPGPETPPGLYGTAQSITAFNLIDTDFTFNRLESFPASAVILTAEAQRPVDLRPPLLLLVLVMFAGDLLLTLWMGGRLRFQSFNLPGRTAVLALCGIGLSLAISTPVAAQVLTDEERFALAAVQDTRLAYVLTGDRQNDQVSHQGLTGLSQALRIRTSVEPGEPIGLNLEADDLSLFPFIYWRIDEGQQTPSARVLEKLDGFMKTGGLFLVDTADQDIRLPGGNRNSAFATAQQGHLRSFLSQLDVPPLEPVPTGHVITKSFYLLSDFPGRFTG
ncbi:MAG: DUF4159 domain-containing protein, partial [Pseudomonadota bacterium]